MSEPEDRMKMPKWLLYGLIGKGLLIAAVIIVVTVYLQ